MNFQDIFGPKKKEPNEEDIVNLHDIFMVEYGWIPLEEFKKLPIPTFMNLINRINKRHEEEAKQMNNGRRNKR